MKVDQKAKDYFDMVLEELGSGREKDEDSDELMKPLDDYLKSKYSKSGICSNITWGIYHKEETE